MKSWMISILLLSLVGCTTAHYRVHDEEELRYALEDPDNLAGKELVIRIASSISDVGRPFVYNGSSDLRLTGAPAELTSHGRNHLLRSNSQVKLTLENLTFSGGRTGVGSERGGAVYHLGDLVINDCKFLDNAAEFGGAVYAGGRVDIQRSRFEHNQARWRGGAVYSETGISTTDSVYQGNSEPVLYVRDKGEK